MSLNTLPFNPFPPSSDQKGSGGGGSYVLPAATAETLGGIKVGDNLTVEEDGTLKAPDPYTLPIAADDTLGGIIVGDNLTVEEDGTLNAADPYSPLNYSTTEQATGQKWIDGQDIYACVFDLESDVSIGSSTYSDTTIDASGIAKIIEARAMQSNGTYKLINASCDSTYVKITSPFSSDTVRYITLFYTKPTV